LTWLALLQTECEASLVARPCAPTELISRSCALAILNCQSFHGRSSVQGVAAACKNSQNDSFKNGIAGDATCVSVTDSR